MKKIITFTIILLVLTSMILLVGCSGAQYNDGVYEGKSSVHEGDDDGGDGYGVVTITIKDNKITECVFKTYETDGTEKDEDYGKQNGEIANRDFYNRAQRALRANSTYASALVLYNALNKVDVVSGATISHDEFVEAVTDALNKAKKQ